MANFFYRNGFYNCDLADSIFSVFIFLKFYVDEKNKIC